VGAGIFYIVAGIFAHIFFRNFMNIALPALEFPAATEGRRTEVCWKSIF
jgi:3-isopropylmalate dehydratase small subunit